MLWEDGGELYISKKIYTNTEDGKRQLLGILSPDSSTDLGLLVHLISGFRPLVRTRDNDIDSMLPVWLQRKTEARSSVVKSRCSTCPVLYVCRDAQLVLYCMYVKTPTKSHRTAAVFTTQTQETPIPVAMNLIERLDIRQIRTRKWNFRHI